MLVTILIVLLILALALYGVRLIPLDRQMTFIIEVVLVIVAIIYIAQVAGLF